MNAIDKAYFTIEEIEERWQLPHRDVVYLAENGLLKLSVRLFDVRLEWGEFEDLGNGDWNRIPTDQRWFSGLQDLREHDAFRLFRDGEARSISLPCLCTRLLPPPGADREHLTLRIHDVVVQRQERDPVEQRTRARRCPRPAVTRSSGSSTTTARSVSRAGCLTLARSVADGEAAAPGRDHGRSLVDR